MRRILAAYLLWTGTALATITGREIVDKQEARHRLENEVSVMEMHLTDRSGGQQRRTLRKSDREGGDGLSKSLVVFLEPADIRGTALLTWEREGPENDQWLYLPSRERLLRVAQGRRDAYFMGTDFTYEDMDPEDLNDYDYELVEDAKVEQSICHVIDVRPLETQRKRSAYSLRRMFIEKERLITLRIEFYGHSGQLIKTQVNGRPEQVSETAWRMGTTFVENHEESHQTRVEVTHRSVDDKIDEDTFTERHIRTGRYLE